MEEWGLYRVWERVEELIGLVECFSASRSIDMSWKLRYPLTCCIVHESLPDRRTTMECYFLTASIISGNARKQNVVSISKTESIQSNADRHRNAESLVSSSLTYETSPPCPPQTSRPIPLRRDRTSCPIAQCLLPDYS